MATRRLPTEQRRAQLTEVALHILAEGGPAALTLAELGRTVGIADASVLRHFKDKDDIIDAAIARFGALLDEDLAFDIENPLRRLGAFFVRRLVKVRARPDLMALAFNSRLRDAAAVKGAVQVDAHVARSTRFIRDCVETAQDHGLVGRTVPAEMWVWMIVGVLRGASVVEPSSSPLAQAPEALSPERTWEIVEALLCKTAIARD